MALPEIMDACALCWSSKEESWQLLSPIFGVLMLQQVHNGERAVMPVAPLLEAAVTRQIAGASRAWCWQHLCVDTRTGSWMQKCVQHLSDTERRTVRPHIAVSYTHLTLPTIYSV